MMTAVSWAPGAPPPAQSAALLKVPLTADAQSMVAMMLLPEGHIITEWLTVGKVEGCCIAGGPEANRTAAR